MATATLPTIPPKDGHHLGIILRLSDELLKTLSEMASLALSGESNKNIDLATCAAMLREVQIADFRLRQIPSDLLVRNDKTLPPDDRKNGRHGRRDGVSIENEDKIVAALEGGMKIGVCSERFSLGESSVRRIWRRAKKVLSAETAQKILFLAGQKYDENDEFISVPAIAKAVHETESVLSRVLANHKRSKRGMN